MMAPTARNGSSLSYERKAMLALLMAGIISVAVASGVLLAVAGAVVEQRRALAAMRQAIADAAEPEKSAAAGSGRAGQPTGARGDASRRLFAAATPTELQSALQSFVKDAATRHQATIDTIQVLKTERAGGLTRVQLRIDGAISEPRLGPYLAELATGEPLVLVQAMEVRPLMLQQNRLGNGGQPVDGVQVRIDVAAFADAAQRAEPASLSGRPK